MPPALSQTMANLINPPPDRERRSGKGNRFGHVVPQPVMTLIETAVGRVIATLNVVAFNNLVTPVNPPPERLRVVGACRGGLGLFESRIGDDLSAPGDGRRLIYLESETFPLGARNAIQRTPGGEKTCGVLTIMLGRREHDT